MSDLIKRTADVIAIEINSIKDQTKKILLASSIEIGRRLVEAKELVPHGEWELWLEKSVDYSKSTAKNLMRIFDEYGSEQISLFGDVNRQALGDLNYTQAVALLSIPADEREQFVKENNMGNMSTRELQKAIKEREQAIKEKEAAEKASEAIAKSLEEMSIENKKLKVESSSEKEARLKAEKEAAVLKKQIKDGVKQTETYMKQVEEYKAKLQDAQSSGNSEEMNDLTEKLSSLNTEIEKLKTANEELESKLNQPIDVITAKPQVIEKIPDEVAKELQELREKANHNSEGDKNVVKFSVQFDGLVKGFKELLGTLEELKDIEIKEKYKTAVKGLISKMLEKV